MTAKTNYVDLAKYRIISPPGDSIAELLAEQYMDQKQLAARTGFSKKHVNEVISGKAALTSDFALALEPVLKVSAEFWVRREATYRTRLARLSAEGISDEEAAWVRAFPYAHMARLGWVKRVTLRGVGGLREKRDELTRFFQIAAAEPWETIWQNPQVAFRRSLEGLKAPEATSAWLRAGEIEAQRLNCEPFNKTVLKHVVADLKGYALQDDINVALSALRGRMRAAGVALVMIPALPGTGISGATHWLNSDLAVLQLSVRYKDDGKFWFTLAHELAHILLHGKRDVFLEGVEGEDEKKEAEANAWATNYWIPSKTRHAFVRRGDFSELAVINLAKRLQIPAGVLVGQLQHFGVHGIDQMNGLKRRWVLKPEEQGYS